MNRSRIISIESVNKTPTSHLVGSRKILLTKEHVDSMLTQTAIGYLTTGQTIEPHRHATMEEYFYVLRGKGTFIIDTVKQNVAKKTLIYISANTEHAIIAKSDLEFLYWGIATQIE